MERSIEEVARTALVARRQALVALGVPQGATGDVAERHADVLDEAAEDARVAESERIRWLERRELEAIDAALARIQLGTFGTCDLCRRAIDARRLAALPWARTCRSCRARAEGTNAHNR